MVIITFGLWKSKILHFPDSYVKKGPVLSSQNTGAGPRNGSWFFCFFFYQYQVRENTKRFSTLVTGRAAGVWKDGYSMGLLENLLFSPWSTPFLPSRPPSGAHGALWPACFLTGYHDYRREVGRAWTEPPGVSVHGFPMKIPLNSIDFSVFLILSTRCDERMRPKGHPRRVNDREHFLKTPDCSAVP